MICDFRNKPENIFVWTLPLIYLIPDGKNIFLGNLLASKIAKIIKKRRIEFDIIHAHYTYPQGFAGLKLAKEFQKPLIVTLHEPNTQLQSLMSWQKEKAKKVWRDSNALIRVNKKDVKYFIEMGAQKIYSIPNGFNHKKIYYLDKNLVRNKLKLPLDMKILLNVAVLVPIKGHKYLIEAMNIISKKRDDVICIIIGDGPMRSCLQKKIKENSLEEKVILLGFKPHDEIPLWMNSADLFVLPSLNEGNPTVMFEALGVGLPFVGTAVGGVPAITTPEDYGLLCKPADPEDLAEKILIALEKEWDR
ncbi:MAG: glycosyltransferase, partial [Leptospiraceae bacterium]|nr:glycosyltransferase [Leptospiraceae bacterium]